MVAVEFGQVRAFLPGVAELPVVAVVACMAGRVAAVEFGQVRTCLPRVAEPPVVAVAGVSPTRLERSAVVAVVCVAGCVCVEGLGLVRALRSRVERSAVAVVVCVAGCVCVEGLGLVRALRSRVERSVVVAVVCVAERLSAEGFERVRDCLLRVVEPTGSRGGAGGRCARRRLPAGADVGRSAAGGVSADELRRPRALRLRGAVPPAPAAVAFASDRAPVGLHGRAVASAGLAFAGGHSPAPMVAGPEWVAA
ncbi:hypothetical protein PV458_32200 [Streptomyces sp. MN03-5084-2B]|nr:hypothetical protein [Streptomyces sp. MN03-5084-2B]